MMSFAEMRDYARKVDDGIEYLENRIQDPQILSLVTSQSARVAENTLESIYDDLMSMKTEIDGNLTEEQAGIKDSNEIVEELGEFINDIRDNLNIIETDLMKFGYIPFPKEDWSQSCDVNSMAAEESKRTEKTGLLSDETVDFSTPNYNSTPDSASYKSEGIKKSGTAMISSNGSSRNNHMRLRNGTPLPLLPSSCRGKRLLAIYSP